VSDPPLTIGELAYRTRVAPWDVERVGLILFLRDVGFSLAEIKALMASRSRSPDAWRELARPKLAELEERIKDAPDRHGCPPTRAAVPA
jgi:DNA-binding transcriptional MerR regulator